jgi:cobalt/nickel transport system permease protein
MHIPDGFLSLPVSAASGAISIGGLSLAIRHVQKRFQDRTVPLMGVMAAFIFAAQMFNFPIAGGTSGHLLGGVLAAVIVGPFAASVVLTCVLIVQCLLFQDGGLLTLGANVLNMAIIGTWAGWAVFAAIKKIIPRSLGMRIGVFLGAWLSVVTASAMAAIELGLSGTATMSVVLMAMVSVHAVIGIAEGVITVLIISFLERVKPELIQSRA